MSFFAQFFRGRVQRAVKFFLEVFFAIFLLEIFWREGPLLSPFRPVYTYDFVFLNMELIGYPPVCTYGLCRALEYF